MIAIEVVVPRANSSTVVPLLSQCCTDVGDVLLGSREYPLPGEMLAIVRLTDDSHIFKHLPILTQALEQQAILSFQFVQGSLIKAVAPSIQEQIADFPFSLGDVWIPAAFEKQCVYLCLHRPLLTAQQAAWLLAREEITWSYV